MPLPACDVPLPEISGAAVAARAIVARQTPFSRSFEDDVGESAAIAPKGAKMS
jgi:hypothetical protein